MASLQARPAKAPLSLAVMLFPTAIFLLLGHDLLISTYGPLDLRATTMAEWVFTGSLHRRVAFTAFGMFGVVLLARRWGDRPRLSGGLGAALAFFFVWSVGSLTWSSEPVLTGRRLPVFAAMCVTAVALGRHGPPAAIVRWVWVSTSVYLLVGVAAETYLGTFLSRSPDYRFAGTLHPNAQGVNCALLVLSGMTLRKLARPARICRAAAIVAALGLLALTRSRTAVLCFMLAGSTYLLLRIARRSRKLLIATTLLAVALVALVLLVESSHPFLVPALHFGREQTDIETLTGRVPLWVYLLRQVGERPLLGSGFGAFWTSSRILDVSSEMGWLAVQAHSAYLEVALELGAVGLIGFVLVLSLGLRRAVSLGWIQQDPFFSFATAVIILFVFQGLVESTVFTSDFPTFVCMTLLLSLAQSSRAAPQEAVSALQVEAGGTPGAPNAGGG